MQVENCEFDRLQSKLDSIQPEKIQKSSQMLKTSILRLNALEEALNHFENHSKQSTVSFQSAIATLQRLCESTTITMPGNVQQSVECYAKNVFNLTEQLTNDRIASHNWLQTTILQTTKKYCTQVVQQSSIRGQQFEEFHKNSKQNLHSIIDQFALEQELRNRDDTHIMDTIHDMLVQVEQEKAEITKSSVDIPEILQQLRTSVALQIRHCKQERQPVEKHIYDMLSALCDHIKESTEL